MRRAVTDLAKHLQAQLRGDSALWISGVSGPEDAAPEDFRVREKTRKS